MSALGEWSDQTAQTISSLTRDIQTGKNEIERLRTRLNAAEDALDAVSKYLFDRTMLNEADMRDAVMAWKRIPRMRR